MSILAGAPTSVENEDRVKAAETIPDDWDTPDIKLPPVSPVLITSSSFDGGDSPSAAELEAAQSSPKALPAQSNIGDQAQTQIQKQASDYDKFTARCLDRGAELSVIGVVSKYLQDGGKENTAEIIVKGSIEKGYDHNFAKKLCAYAKAGKDDNAIIDLITSFKKDPVFENTRDKSILNSTGSQQSRLQQNSPISIGFSRLFHAVQSAFNRPEVVSVEGLASSRKNLEESANSLLNSSYVKNVSSIREGVQDIEQRNKLIAGLHPDREAIELMSKFNEAAAKYQKTAIKTIGKCKDTDEVDFVKSTINDDLTSLKARYTERLDGIVDMSRSAIKDIFDSIGNKIDGVIEMIMNRMAQKHSKASSPTAS